MLHCNLPLISRTLLRFLSRFVSPLALALAALTATALPAHAQRTVTATGLGNGGFAVTPVDSLHTCTNGDMGADACAGAFSYGEDSAAVDSIVSTYRSAHPSNFWGSATVETSIGGASSTTGLFDYGGSLFGGLRFQQELRGHFVVVLSGRWASTPIGGGGGYLREPFSAYYLFDDVVAEAFSVATPNFLRWNLSEGPAPDVVPGVLDFFGTRGLTVDRVSIYIYAPANVGNVPEPGSLALAGLALAAAAFVAATTTRRRRRASV